MTLLTTIGYGHVCPLTPAARLATVFYGALGIPLIFATIYKIGSIMANLMICLFTLSGQKSKAMKHIPSTSDLLGSLFGMLIGILLFILYVVATSFLLRDHIGYPGEDDYPNQGPLTFVDALYLNFITLSTTGFGDIVPNMTGLFYVYLIFGLVINFLNINLIKTFVENVSLLLC